MSEYPALFTDSSLVPPSERRQTRVSCEQNAFPRFAAVTSKLSPKCTKKVTKFLLEFIDKTGEKVFCLQMQISLSLALLYLVDLFINKLKTKFNNLFYRMILNTKRIQNSFWRNFPARAKQMPSKVLFVGKKKRRPRPFGHCAPKCNRWQQ